ncbi:MAG TPA: hypothetical protein VMU87_14710 [Stellaceae bacterium]|nr:hypothetical protein [Stellaceae bacterium]
MVTRAVLYNHEVEKATNDDLLLNVIRASFGHPLYFTDFTDVHSPLSSSLGFASTVPIGVPGESGLSLVPNFSISENVAQFGIGVLNSSNFIRGISTPVSVPTIDLFRQSYDIDQLLNLFVGRIETAGSQTLSNDPSTPDEMTRFEGLLRLLITLGLTTETTEEQVTIGADMTADQVRTLDHANVLSRPDIDLVEAKDNPPIYRLEQTRNSQRFCFSAPPVLASFDIVRADLRQDFAKRVLAITCRNWITAHLARPHDSTLLPDVLRAQEVDRFLAQGQDISGPLGERLTEYTDRYLPGLILGLRPDELVPATKAPPRPPASPNAPGQALDLGPITLYLRSPRQMLDYLGQIAALQTRGRAAGHGRVPGPRVLSDKSYEALRQAACAPPAVGDHEASRNGCPIMHPELLFRVFEDGKADGMPFLASVTYLDHRYRVMTGDNRAGGRSSQTLSILSELLSLYRTASDLPRTTPVRLYP